MLFHERIEILMEKNNISKQEFIQKLLFLNPISKRTKRIIGAKTIYAYMAGTRFPDAEHYPLIAKVLGVSLSVLFGTGTKEIEVLNQEELVFNALQNPTKNIKKIIEDYNHSHGFIRGDIIGDGSNNGHTINHNTDKVSDSMADKLVDIFNSLDEEKKERIFLDVLQYKYSGS